MLHMLLNVFDGEELLVVHSESSRTFRIKIWGISDNFQLHILLAGTSFLILLLIL